MKVALLGTLSPRSVLEAIPDEQSNASSTLGNRTVAYKHGWPFLHLVRTEAIVDRTCVNRRYVADRLPSKF